METFFIKAIQLILSLSILVIIHEFGHFLFARLFKIRVEKFYLFFNPWFSLFKFKPKNSDTEYGIGWLPLGGYVKISGMIDESMDKEQMAKPAQPWEFRSKPAWQRLLVMVGGVLFNFILAMLIFSGMMFVWGDEYLPMKNIKHGMSFSETVKASGGFKENDILINADGKDLVMRGGVLDMNTLMGFIDAKTVEIERDGKRMTLNLPDDFSSKVIDSHVTPYEMWASTIVDSIMPDRPAQKAGLQKGDSIAAIDSVSVMSYMALRKEISSKENKTINISYYRNGEPMSVSVAVDSAGTIGFSSLNVAADYQLQHDKYGFFESIPVGISMGVNTLKAYVSQMRYLFNKEGVKNLGGFGAIGNLFPEAWNWQYFWTMTAFLSIILAFMNILPIPALDGGHIMFLLYEVVTRRAPSEKFMEYAQMVGMILVIGLILVSNGNDIIRAIFN